MRLDSHPQGGMMRTFVVAFSVAVLSSVYLPVAQQPAAQQPQQPMSFFIASAASGQSAVNARDRIGAGPWYNAKGARIAQNVADLHGDTLEAARRGNNLTKQTALTEKGDTVNGVGDTPNRHDMLTGSQLDGTAFTDGADHTCGNWTNSGAGTAQLGHHDRTGGGNTSWNSAHPSRGCSQENLVSTGGAGLFYCFAIN